MFWLACPGHISTQLNGKALLTILYFEILYFKKMNEGYLLTYLTDYPQWILIDYPCFKIMCLLTVELFVNER